jgi:hypothetical protein
MMEDGDSNEDKPSFEPTVLKYPAEKPPVKAPCNRLRPFSSRTYNALSQSEQGAIENGHTSCFHMGMNSLASFFSKGGKGVPI